MKRVLLLILVAAVSVSAQTSLSQWPHYAEVKPEKSEPGLYQVALPIWVMDKASRAPPHVSSHKLIRAT